MMIGVVTMFTLAKLGLIRKGNGTVRHLVSMYEAGAHNQFYVGQGGIVSCDM